MPSYQRQKVSTKSEGDVSKGVERCNGASIVCGVRGDAGQKEAKGNGAEVFKWIQGTWEFSVMGILLSCLVAKT